MPDAYVIEIDGAAAGIVARQPGEREYRFYASLPRFRALELNSFANAAAAHKAVRRLTRQPAAPVDRVA